MNPKASFGNNIPQQATGNYTTAFSSAEAEREGGLQIIRLIAQFLKITFIVF